MEPFPAWLSVCLSARTSESINTSQNAQAWLTCSPPFISGENKHGLWVLSSSVFFRASIVLVFAAFQPATLGKVHLVLPGTWGTPWLLWDYPSLQNKQFFTDALSGVFPYRCPGVRRGQDRRDLTCVNPLDASCSSPEQCHSLSKTSTGTGAASGKPKGGIMSHTSAHSNTLHVCRQLKIECRKELLITNVSTETQLPYPSFPSS